MNSYMERVICRAVIVDLQLSIVNCQLSIVNFMKKFLPDLIAILAFIILSFAYFFPADIEGRILFQHDTVAGGEPVKKLRNILNVQENVPAGQTLFLVACLPIRCLRVMILPNR